MFVFCGLRTVWGGHCLFDPNLKHNPKSALMPDLSKVSWHLVVWRCVLLSSAEWAVKTGKRRGGFLTTVRPGLEKHAWWVHGRYFWVFQARRWNSSGDLRSSGHSLACPAKLSGCERRVNDILAQRVGRCFTLNGHTAGELTLTGAVCSGSETEHLLQDSLHGAPSTTGWSTGPWTVLCIVKTLFVNCA